MLIVLFRSSTADGTKSVSFGRNGVRITDSTNRIITTGSLIDGVYTLNCTVSLAARGGNLAKIPPNQVIADFGRGSSVESESE